MIGADWLVYQDLDDLIASVSHDNAGIDAFDTSCFSGEYVTADVTRGYLEALESSRSDAARSRRDAQALADEDEGDDAIQAMAGGL